MKKLFLLIILIACARIIYLLFLPTPYTPPPLMPNGCVIWNKYPGEPKQILGKCNTYLYAYYIDKIENQVMDLKIKCDKEKGKFSYAGEQVKPNNVNFYLGKCIYPKRLGNYDGKQVLNFTITDLVK